MEARRSSLKNEKQKNGHLLAVNDEYTHARKVIKSNLLFFARSKTYLQILDILEYFETRLVLSKYFLATIASVGGSCRLALCERQSTLEKFFIRDTVAETIFSLIDGFFTRG